MSRLFLSTATALGALACIAAAPAALAQSATMPAPAPAATAPTASPAPPAHAAPAPKPARAQPAAAPAGEPSSALQRAELAELGPKVRAEVTKRATDGNTIRGVLETMLLNGVELRDPGNRIAALDLGRGVAVMQGPQHNLQVIHFDKNTLAIR